MKKSIILLEIIFTVVLLSIIYLITVKYIYTINEKNKTNYTTNLTKIAFETTRLFLISTLKAEQNLNQISYRDKQIFYNDKLLQNKVESFDLTKINDIYKVNICINLSNNICQTWIIK